MRCLVLGVSGMAGHLIACYLKECGHDVVGFSRREVSFVKFIQGDVTDIKGLSQIILSGGFDIVVNAVGLLNKDAEEHRDRAVFLNAYLPNLLVELSKDTPTRIIHMSTDCVFAGNTGPYTEESFPDGTTFYDRSKALGELKDKKNLTLRNSIVGPDISEKGIGLLNWFMQQNNEVQGYCNVQWTGLTTLELAKIIHIAASSEAVGLINMVPKSSISKYDLLCLFNDHLRPGRKVKVLPQQEPVLDKTLVRTNFSFDYEVPDYERMVSEMAGWILTHQNLYPPYYFQA